MLFSKPQTLIKASYFFCIQWPSPLRQDVCWQNVYRNDDSRHYECRQNVCRCDDTRQNKCRHDGVDKISVDKNKIFVDKMSVVMMKVDKINVGMIDD